MGIPRRFHVAALSALAVMLLLLVNTLYDDNMYTEPIFTNSTYPVDMLLMISDIYVDGYERPHPELCESQNTNLRLVIFVTSAPSHFEARTNIRRKWKQYASQAGIAFAFMLGVPKRELLPRIEAEDELHGDIVMGRFVDSYSNLTLKTLSMLEWVKTYCPQASYLLKTDDDMNVHVDRLLKFIEFANTPRTMWGKMWRDRQPIRTTASKYYMPLLQFPKRRYPDYLSGGAYLMTADCVPLLLTEAMREPYLRMEDVFVTGILASRQSIHLVHVAEFIGEITEHV